MNAIEDYEDISIIWSKPKHELTAKNLFIVVQAEVGFVPFILAAGMASKNKHSCEILSRHMSVEAFNKMPDPVPRLGTSHNSTSTTHYALSQTYSQSQWPPTLTPKYGTRHIRFTSRSSHGSIHEVLKISTSSL